MLQQNPECCIIPVNGYMVPLTTRQEIRPIPLASRPDQIKSNRIRHPTGLRTIDESTMAAGRAPVVRLFRRANATEEGNRPEMAEDGALGPELTLRPFSLSDVDDFMVWATDDRVSRFCSWDTYTSSDGVLAYLRDIVLPHPYFRAICLAGRPVGAISLIPGSGNDRCRAEIGYVLAADHWGKGVATRAVKLVVSTIFEEWGHLERLEGVVDVDNLGSQKVLEKAGFRREGVLRRYFVQKGRVRDVVMFSFISTDPKPQGI